MLEEARARGADAVLHKPFDPDDLVRTVQTLLNRLQGKGFAASEKGGPAHVYRAALSREQFLQGRLHDLANEFCEGTASPLVLALVEGGRFTPDEIERFRQLLDRLESTPSRKKGFLSPR